MDILRAALEDILEDVEKGRLSKGEALDRVVRITEAATTLSNRWLKGDYPRHLYDPSLGPYCGASIGTTVAHGHFHEATNDVTRERPAPSQGS